LHINSSVVLEDLGSANGTVVRGRKVPSGKRVNVRPGDTIEIGRALLVLQRSRVLPVEGIPLHSHDYFQERLDEECRRGMERAFGLFRVRTCPGLGQELLRRMAEMLTSSDLVAVGEFGPDDYEVLVLGTLARCSASSTSGASGLDWPGIPGTAEAPRSCSSERRPDCRRSPSHAALPTAKRELQGQICWGSDLAAEQAGSWSSLNRCSTGSPRRG
jgi:hypothetical protein